MKLANLHLKSIITYAGTWAAIAIMVSIGQTQQQEVQEMAAPPDTLRPDLSVVEQELSRVNAEIDQTFCDTLSKAAKIPDSPNHRLERLQTLGKLLLYDRRLSVKQNTACVSCHMPETGFTGPISELNRTTASYPGSVRSVNADPRYSRYAKRKPQSYSYAPYSPILHYNITQKDFYGGNFWDMRASGWKLQNPAAEQAQDPLTDPNEQGFIDPACVVYRISQSPYREFFESIWGAQAFDIRWPSDIEQVCQKPGPPNPDDPFPVHLSRRDRGRCSATYDQVGLSIAANEAGPETSPFTSKFDYALAHPDKPVLSKDELAGWQLFRTKGKCTTCHLDGTSMLAGQISPAKATDMAPLFSDFTAANLGIPKNQGIPYYKEDKADKYGYIVNPSGERFVDLGVGAFLRSTDIPDSDWSQYAKQFDGKFQVPTLRNVDLRPSPEFVKAYGHNGYFKSLKEIVHFYNTRDKLPRCQPGDADEKTLCWPGPEVSANIDKTIGDLGLTDHEENQIVLFLKTLSDGYKPPKD